jgi:hypothetical protein
VTIKSKSKKKLVVPSTYSSKKAHVSQAHVNGHNSEKNEFEIFEVEK